jgi:hypothetical protein
MKVIGPGKCGGCRSTLFYVIPADRKPLDGAWKDRHLVRVKGTARSTTTYREHVCPAAKPLARPFAAEVVPGLGVPSTIPIPNRG